MNKANVVTEYVMRVLLVILISPVAHACLAVKPLDKADAYDQIFKGVVTGVHMVADEKMLISNLNPQSRIRFLGADTQLPFKVFTVTKENIKGKPEEVREIILGGCGVVPPKIFSEYIFFVRGSNADMREASSFDSQRILKELNSKNQVPTLDEE